MLYINKSKKKKENQKKVKKQIVNFTNAKYRANQETHDYIYESLCSIYEKEYYKISYEQFITLCNYIITGKDPFQIDEERIKKQIREGVESGVKYAKEKGAEFGQKVESGVEYAKEKGAEFGQKVESGVEYAKEKGAKFGAKVKSGVKKGAVIGADASAKGAAVFGKSIDFTGEGLSRFENGLSIVGNWIDSSGQEYITLKKSREKDMIKEESIYWITD